MPDDMKMLEKDIKEMNQALGELRTAVEGKDKDSGEVKTKVAKLEQTLDALDKKNQDWVAERAKEAKAAAELKEQFGDLEKKLTRLQAAGKDTKQVSDEMKAFERFAAKGMQGLPETEQKYLRTDSDTEGGYLAPNEYVQEIIKKITEVSPLRQFARVRRTARGEIEIPKRTSLVSGGFRGEGGTMQTGNSKYGMVKIPAHFLDVIVVATTSMLSDSAFNMETEINADVVESFAQLEGAAFINGSLPVEPEGIMKNADVSIDNSGIANDITADNFFTTQGELKRGYNPMWMMNRRTLARVRKMKDGMGQYLFAAPTQGQPANIAGDPYALAIDMDDIGANKFPVLYGDILRGYTVVDGIGLTMLRDPYTLADTGKVRFVFSKRVGGKVVLAEALRKIKCSA